MSIHTILCRIATKRLGGIIPSTSAGVILSIPSATMWKNFDSRRSLSNDMPFDVVAELRGHPLIQWFDRSINASCNHAQNLIENSGLSNSPLEHLGLYTWWKPSSWHRVFLEYLHTNYELSWLAAIICATVLIRTATLYLPALIVWKKTKIRNFQRPFLHHFRSLLGSIMLYSSSIGLFLTQYGGIKKMAEVVYPNWTTGGTLSFIDLTVPDSGFLLPFLTAICFTFASKEWIETLRMQKTVSNWMLGLKSENTIYPIAVCSFLVATNVPSAVCIYWITSSLISGVHAKVLRISTMRSLLCLPDIYLDPAEIRRTELLNYFSEMRRKRANGMLQIQKRTAEIEKRSQEEDKLSKSLENEAESIRLETDSLFPQPWKKDIALSSSKIAKLMEQHIQEAARVNAMSKSGKPNSIIRTDSQKLKIDEITAN